MLHLQEGHFFFERRKLFTKQTRQNVWPQLIEIGSQIRVKHKAHSKIGSMVSRVIIDFELAKFSSAWDSAVVESSDEWKLDILIYGVDFE